MVKLCKTHSGAFTLCVPHEKVKKKRWKGGEEFDVSFDVEGNLVFTQINGKE